MSEPAATPWLPQRLIFVLGKGGVGRSTVAAALGLLSTRRGARTVVAELGGRGELPRMFGAVGTSRGEVRIAPGLFTIQIEPEQSLKEYLHQQLPLRMLADLFGATRTIGFLAAATPGLPELLSIGKIWELAEDERIVEGAARYDRVIVDAPASGHAMALLSAPQTFSRAAQRGPIARQAQRISDVLIDPARSALLAVATPEPAAVGELLELSTALRTELGRGPDAVILNALPPSRFTAGDCSTLAAVLASPSAQLTPANRAALARAIAAERAQAAAEGQLARLAEGVDGIPCAQLAFSYAPELGIDDLELLATELEAVL